MLFRNKKRLQNRSMVLLKAFYILILLLLLSLPLILNGTFSGDLSAAWIGFWGSFAGGILGTLGVIYVAKVQSDEQRKLNEESMEEQRSLNNDQIKTQIESMKKVERNNRIRLKIETQIDLLREYNKNLHKINKELNKYSSLTLDLIHELQLAEDFRDSERITSRQEISINTLKDKMSHLNDDYFIELFDEIVYVSYVLRIEDSNLQEPLSQDVQNNVDDLLWILKSDNILSSMRIKFGDENIEQNNYIDILKEKHKSFSTAFKWILTEIANSNKDLGDILIKLK